MMHPSERTLIRYAEGSLDERRKGRVSLHLERCARCRGAIVELRRIDEAARALPDPELPHGALDSILARRAAGERVILPVSAEPVRAQPRYGAGAVRRVAALFAVVLVGGLVLSRAPEATAQASELHIDVERPQAGGHLNVEYNGVAGHADIERLVLRGRLRTPTSQAYNRTARPRPLAVLVRGEDGAYRGAFTLPDSVVYALLVVERADGTVLDHNGRRGWEVIVHHADGRPVAEALIQRANDMMGRDWEEAHRSAIRLAQIYPDEPQSWNLVDFYERQLFGHVDSLRALHQQRLVRFDERLRGGRVTGDQAGWMLWYSRGVQDSVREAYWRQRLIAEHPSHSLAVQERVSDISDDMRAGASAAEVLARFELLWQEVGPAHSNVPLVAGFMAQAAADTQAIRTWADRYTLFHPADDGVYTMLEVPDMRVEAMRRLRLRVARIESQPDSARDLFETREEFAQRSADDLRDAFALLGEALLEDGATRAGLDTLALAIDGGWDASLFDTVARARLAAGDTSGAIALFARVAVDPGTDASFADTVRAQLGHAPDRATWTSLTEDARREMRLRVLEEARNRALGREVRLLDDGGSEVRLDDLRAGRPTVVAFWSRHCGPALQQLPAVVALERKLAARGAALIVITEEQRADELTRLLAERAPGLEVYHDQWRDATLAFQSWGTPQYFVLDADGRLRYEYSAVEDVLRQVSALSDTPVAARGG